MVNLKSHTYDPEVVLELNLRSKLGQLRAIPVCLGGDREKAVLAIYCSDFEVDPYHEMFFFPNDTLKMMLFTQTGEILWEKDLGKGVIPGHWFCPVFPFDLDGDGSDEIWYVNNIDQSHPLGLKSYRLERLDAKNGDVMGQWVWPSYGGFTQNIGQTFRNFIMGGYVKGEPVLISAQGTYKHMYLQGWNKNMSGRWSLEISGDAPGARGSHKCPVIDLNNDGVDEILWGERCIEIDTGKELFCADRDSYKGHSDGIHPVYDPKSKRWYIFTARESDAKSSPRVNLYDDKGNRVWGSVEAGHMDMSWVARMGEEHGHIAMATRIDGKTAGPDGLFHKGCIEYTFNALTGEEVSLPFSTYRTVPVDINGDGIHEFAGNGMLLDMYGNVIAQTGGQVAMASKLIDYPGEQLLIYYPEGIVRIWGDKNAVDCTEAKARYEHPFYKLGNRLSASGSNLGIIAGL